MSSGRGGTFRGGGGGSGFTARDGARGGTNSSRGRGNINMASRGSGSTRGSFGQASQSNFGQGLRGGGNATRGGQFKQQKALGGGAKTQGAWQDRYDTLKHSREQERKDAITQGHMADPEKPRSLADAITPVGTCQDMCPEFERVQRVVQNDVWDEEKDSNHSAFARGEPEPIETRMVKKFRRSAAGYEEQIPSDLRPPPVLKKTCDYLFGEVIGNAPSLAKVHHFVWDRTRAIRNDLSIQQLTKADDVRIAIDCYERIARFHIVSLHQLALEIKPYDKYDAHQEREQLDRTLLSLLLYYDDNRGRLELTNEAEFRAYCVIFQLQDPTPDLEDRVQSWPAAIVRDDRIQKALQVYAAACQTSGPKGPLKPPTVHVIARQNWEQFWSLISSPGVSYIMACVAEIYFNLVRHMALKAIVRTARVTKAPNVNTDWTIDELWEIFNFDEEAQLVKFCERSGLSFSQRPEDGKDFLDLGSCAGRSLPDTGRSATQGQLKSSLVEEKRHGRTLPAVINGLNVQQAIDAGLVEEHEDEMEDAEYAAGSHMTDNDSIRDEVENAEDEEAEDPESLFIPEPKANIKKLIPNDTAAAPKPTTTFGLPSGGFSFGAPSAPLPPASQTPFNFASQRTVEHVPKQDAGDKKQLFDFAKPKITAANPADAVPGRAASSNIPIFNFGKPSNAATPVNTAPLQIAPVKATDASTSSSFLGQPSAPVDKQSSKGPTSFASPFATKSDAVVAMTATPSATSPHWFTPGSVTNEVSGLARDVFKPLAPASLPAPASAPVQTVPGLPSWPTARDASTFGEASRPAETPSFSASPEAAPKSSLEPRAVPVPAATDAQPPPNTSLKSASADKFSRLSTTGDHRPKSPSPLVNSFTAGDNTPSFTTAQSFGKPSSAKTDSAPTTARASVASPVTTINPDDVLSRLAEEITTCPGSGFLPQFVNFSVSKVVKTAHDKIHAERLAREADDFRRFCLYFRYAKRWRDICRHRRLARQARERRNRAHRRLQETENVDSSSVVPAASVRSGGRAHSALDVTKGRKETTEAVLQNTSIRGMGNVHAKLGSKRSASSNAGELAAASYEPGHKRLKSDSQINSHNEAGKPSTEVANADLLKRSAFLGFSASNNSVHRTCTTKSTYFRMKAMGVQATTASDIIRGTKRSRSNSTDDQAAPLPLQLSLAQGPPSKARARDAGLMLPPPPRKSKTTPVDDEVEALFTRVKAARERLKEDGALLKTEVAREEEQRRSTKDQSSGNSPSMVQARVDAEHHTYQLDRGVSPSVSEGSVPAYRLRESRFVPREHYHRAIERANDLRASRSRESSRSASRTQQRSDNQPEKDLLGSDTPSKPSEQVSGQREVLSRPSGNIVPPTDFGSSNRSAVSNSLFGFNRPTFDNAQASAISPSQAQTAAMGRASGFGFDQAKSPGTTPSGPPLLSDYIPQNIAPSVDKSQTFSKNESRSTFGAATTQTPSSFTQFGQPPSNPYPMSLSPGFGTQTMHDHTIAPSQIDTALTQTFGHAESLDPALHVSQDEPIETATKSQAHSGFGSQTSVQNTSSVGVVQEAGDFGFRTGFQSVNGLNGRGTAAEHLESDEEEEDQQDTQASNGHDNRYALLADDDDHDQDNSEFGGSDNSGDETQQHTRIGKFADEYSEDESGSLDEDDYSESSDVDVRGPVDYDQAGEDDQEDGDIEDYDEDDEDEDGYDEDEEDEEATPGSYVPMNYAFNQQHHVQKNPELQGVGGTAEEAIELSD